jgi:tetraacyldisaccharide 4'-kinase
MLEAEGLVFERLPLPDHHRYTEAPWQGWAGEVILVTEKDAVKLLGEAFEADERVHVVTLDFHLDAAFFTAFDRLLPPR